jgi:hypothetical protein
MSRRERETDPLGDSSQNEAPASRAGEEATAEAVRRDGRRMEAHLVAWHLTTSAMMVDASGRSDTVPPNTVARNSGSWAAR